MDDTQGLFGEPAVDGGRVPELGDDGLVRFECPRCATSVVEEFYGPCTSCRQHLVATYRGEARVVEVAEYVPKMNVTPNAVALKDD